MGKLRIIAVDFDGTLCENDYPFIGSPVYPAIYSVKDEIRKGSKIILWTCRRGIYLDQAVKWCKEHGLEFDAVNENIPEMIEFFNGDTRKVFANEYWDDRAVRFPQP